MSENQNFDSQPKTKNKVSKEFIESLKNTAKLPNPPPQMLPQAQGQQQFLFPMPTPEEAKKIVEQMKRRGQIPPPFLLPPKEAQLAIEELKRRGIPYPPPPFLESAPKNFPEEKIQQQSKKKTSQESDDILEQDINKIALEKHQSSIAQEQQPTRNNRIQSPDQKQGSTKKGDYRPRTQRSLIKSIYEDQQYPNNRKGNISRNYIPRSPPLGAQKINKSYRQIPRYRQEQIEEVPKGYREVPKNREQDLANQQPKRQEILAGREYARYGQLPNKSGRINDQRDYLDNRDPRYVDYKNVSPQFYRDNIPYNPQRQPKAPHVTSKSNIYNPINKLLPAQNYEGSKYRHQRGAQYSDYELKLRRNYDNLYPRDYDRQEYYEKSPVMRTPQELAYNNKIKQKNIPYYPPTKNGQQYYQQEQVPYTNLKDELRNITNVYGDQYPINQKIKNNVTTDYAYKARGQHHLGMKRNIPADKLYENDNKGYYYENKYVDLGYDRKNGYLLGDKNYRDGGDYYNHRQLIQNNKRYL